MYVHIQFIIILLLQFDGPMLYVCTVRGEEQVHTYSSYTSMTVASTVRSSVVGGYVAVVVRLRSSRQTLAPLHSLQPRIDVLYAYVRMKCSASQPARSVLLVQRASERASTRAKGPASQR